METTVPQEMELAAYLDEIAGQGRTMLLPSLLFVQEKFGYISPQHARQIGKALKVPLADISGMIEFYTMLDDTPFTGKRVRICTSPVCASKGGETLYHTCQQQFEAEYPGEYLVEKTACLGLCDHAPSAMLDDLQVGEATPEKILQGGGIASSSIYGDVRYITQGITDYAPLSLKAYLALGGFTGLKNALGMSPQEVVATVKDSGLRGRGGAGFPTGLKWEGAAQAAGSPKYVICNMDESEPGTVKDQIVMNGNPFAVLEGLLISAYAVGAEYGYVYIRGEYPESRKILEEALQKARRAHYLGKNILGTAFSFEVEVRSGAGAYICGEETALFESIEGKRGFPRIKPPFPTTHGVFGKPTAINNVETLANIPLIFRIGVGAYREMGTAGTPGPRLFSLSGDVARPGLYELTNPVTLGELIFDLAGGMKAGRSLQGVLLGGAAGKFVGPEALELLLTDDDTRKAGLSLGSGAVMVFDDTQDMREILAVLGEFFAHESCGKCYPCQLGTQRQMEILERNREGALLNGDVARLKDIGWTMTDASLCGLGQTAALAVMSAIDLWPDLFVEREA
ncbi:NAD(P)H-dependent oxidoreductase subunit E [bacterium]|nr:NAD(P)H-dependent oxidoreductase subunit E [bacterium]